MYRFLILAWDAADIRKRREAASLARRLLAGNPQWTRVLDAPGVSAFHAGVRPAASDVILLHGTGAIFGTLFARTSAGTIDYARVRAGLDEPASHDIVASGGERLLEKWWGRYVALLLLADSSVRVLRDPSGTLPCFHCSVAGVNVFFSNAEDILALTTARFSINWTHVAGFLRSADSPARETGLGEITAVQPGECVELRTGSMQRFLAWDPAAIARRDIVEDSSAATAALRATTRACVGAWSSCYPAIVHSLSGGLDSSIVLDCVARSAPRPALTCLTHFGIRADDDERSYARLAAAHAGVGLVECRLDPAGIHLPAVLEVRRSPVLSSYIGNLQRQPAEARVAAERGAQAIFSGAGGDGLFFQARAELAVTDFVREHGMRRGLLAVALDAARISHRSAWQLLASGIRRRFSSAAARGIGPAKQWQISSLSAAPAFEDPVGSDDDPERTHPLLSQPLVELCLRIPAYVLIRGGWDRAIARRAFATSLPDAIVRRRGKGNISGFSACLLDRNRAFVRELLLDGLLVKEGLLEREKIERSLRTQHALADYESSEILHRYVSAEAWLRRWQA